MGVNETRKNHGKLKIFSVAALLALGIGAGVSGNAMAATSIDAGTGGTFTTANTVDTLTITATSGTTINSAVTVNGVATATNITATNATDIAANASTNVVQTGLISTNTVGVTANASTNVVQDGLISTNTVGVTANASTNVVQDGLISTNTVGVTANASTNVVQDGLISTNASNITVNSTGISTNTSTIEGFATEFETENLIVTNSAIITSTDGPNAAGFVLGAQGVAMGAVNISTQTGTGLALTEMGGGLVYADHYGGTGSGIVVGPGFAAMGVMDATVDGNHEIDSVVLNGMVATSSSLMMQGGTGTTTLTLDDDGATFNNAQIHGLAPGTMGNDAVNKNQLDDLSEDAYSGIAGVAAMAAIPAPMNGHKYAFGMGAGHYKGESALAAGFNANMGTNFRLTGALGWTNGGSLTSNLGLGYSW